MVSPYFEKCKRFRDDGPTPCLCCPGECVGDQHEFDGHPGFYYQRRDYEDDSQRASMLFAVVAAFIVATCATAFVIAAVLHARGMG